MINNPRVFIWIALAVVLWLNYEAWNRDYASAASPARQSSLAQATGAVVPNHNGLDAAIPQASTGTTSTPATPAPISPPAPGASAPLTNSAPANPSQTIHVKTDVLDMLISLQGGTMVQADLPAYPRVKGQPEPMRLLNHDSAQTLFALQSGLTGPAGPAHANHLATFTSEQHDYVLPLNQSELRVPLRWTDGQGVTVEKTFVFRRSNYRIDVEYLVVNQTDKPYEAAEYAQILRNDPKTERSMFNVESYAFHGPAIYDGAKYRKLDIADEDDRQLALEVKNGWIAALQHHFVTAVVPPTDIASRITMRSDQNEYLLATAGPIRTIAPSATDKITQTFFVGPKLQAQLETTGPRLDLVADYGKLTILSKPLFWLLEQVHAFLGNWGLAIIIVTALLKLVFYPLSETSGKSMAKMKMLAPRIKNMQEQYKDDREKLGKAMMELYQREKVNPVAGCLPIIIQIPVFLAFYWVLLESVEMRQAPFFGWINDLSSRDPFFILPAIMAGAMFIQYKLQPTPADPIQAKVFMVMPLAMSAMFAFFPAGLVLYWVTNTILSIAQQWNINRRIEGAKKA